MNEEQLKEIEYYASKLRSPKEICLIMGLQFDDVKDAFITKGNEVYNAYNKGQQITIVKHVDIIIKLAGEGSSAAQVMLENIINELKIKELDELT